MKDCNGKLIEEGDQIVFPASGNVQGTVKKITRLIEPGGPPVGVARMEVEVTFKFAFPANIDVLPIGAWLTNKAAELKPLLSTATQ